jgi:hypothetical protein
MKMSSEESNATESIETALKTALEQRTVVSTQISKLQQTREELDAQIALYRSKLSPWHLLSDDIIAEIFERCLLHYPGQRAPMSITAAPLVLLRVSRQWRAVALSTNSLWASVHFVFPSILIQGTRSEQRYLARLDALRAWLSRSGSVPISISFAKLRTRRDLIPNWTYDDEGARAFRALLPVISQVANQLQAVILPELHFYLGSKSLRESDIHDMEFPVLEHLKDFTFNFQAYWPNILKAPRIRVLSIAPYGFENISGPLTQFSWSQLTDLTISDACSSQTLIGLLSICLELRCLDVKCAEDDPDRLSPPPYTNINDFLLQTHYQQSGGSVTLLHLHTLTLVGSGTNQLVKNLYMPNLKHLVSYEIIKRSSHIHQDDPEWLGLSLFSFQALQIEQLKLSIHTIISATHVMKNLAMFLRTQHNLRKVQICVDDAAPEDTVDSTTRFLEAMADPSFSIPPMLEELELTKISDESVETTLNLLQRITISSKLRKVRVVIPRSQIEFSRKEVGRWVNQRKFIFRESLVKMKDFLDSPDVVGGPISIIVTGNAGPQAALSEYQDVNPFFGLESMDSLYIQQETALHDLFKEDMMLSWPVADENSSNEEATH